MSYLAGDERIDLDEGGALDDVVIKNVETFRMERMSAGRFWIRLYRKDGKDIVFWLSASENNEPQPRDDQYRIDGAFEYD